MLNTIFKGPQYYQESDKDSFFGRDQEIKELYYLVSNSDFCVCYAESGEGKSSLINAGLIPILRENDYFPICIKFEEKDIKKEICFDEYVWEKFEKTIENVKNDEENFYNESYSSLELYRSTLAEVDHDFSKKMWWKLRTHELRINSFKKLTPVFIFDQFEEIFTRPNDVGWTNSFFRWLNEIYQDDSPDSNKFNNPLCKEFKVILSLRSEYVYELDYWSMNRGVYIPSLKNNRYCLKPLMKFSAINVLDNLIGLSNSLRDNILKTSKSHLSGDVDIIKDEKDDYPCISALPLQLIATEINKNDDIVKEKMAELSGQQFLNFILLHIYEKAVKECADEESVRKLEDALIDSDGNRRRPSKGDLVGLSGVVEILKKNGIVHDDYGIIEFSHDSLLKVISQRKKERDELRLLSLQRKTNNIILGFCLFTTFIFYLGAYILLYKRYYPGIDDSFGVTVLHRVFTLIPILFPLLIASYLKRIGIFYSIAIGTLLIYATSAYYIYKLGFNSPWIELPYCVITVAIPLLLFLKALRDKQSWKHKKIDIIILWNQDYLVVFFFIIAIFQFLCDNFGSFYYISHTNSDKLSHIFNTPNTSSLWFFIIPILFIDLIRRSFNLGLSVYKSEYYFSFLVCLFILFFNVAHVRVPFFPLYIIIGTIVAAMVSLYFFFKKSNIIKTYLFTSFLFIIIISLVCINIGFCLNRVDYDKVKRVFSWDQVLIKEKNGKLGILSWKGDTILPCYVDSFDNRNVFITSVKSFSLKPIDGNKSNSMTYYSISLVKKDDVIKFSYPYYQFMERNMLSKQKLEQSDNDSKIKYYSIQTYKKLRNLNMRFLSTGKYYTLDDVDLIKPLDSIQGKKTKEILDSLNISNLNDNAFCELIKNLTKSLLIDGIMDRINQRDTCRTIVFPEEIVLAFLPECYEYNAYTKDIKKDTIHHLNIDINPTSTIDIPAIRVEGKKMETPGFKREYTFTVHSSDLRNNQSLAWINYLKYIMSLDCSYNLETYKNNLIKSCDILNSASKDKDLNKIITATSRMQKLNNYNNRSESFQNIVKLFFKKVINNDGINDCIYKSVLLDIYDNMLLMGLLRNYDMYPDALAYSLILHNVDSLAKAQNNTVLAYYKKNKNDNLMLSYIRNYAENILSANETLEKLHSLQGKDTSPK